MSEVTRLEEAVAHLVPRARQGDAAARVPNSPNAVAVSRNGQLLPETLDVLKLPALGSFLPGLAVGFVAAALVGWLSIRWLLNYLTRHSLYVFSAYCAVIGLLTLILQLVK